VHRGTLVLFTRMLVKFILVKDFTAIFTFKHSEVIQSFVQRVTVVIVVINHWRTGVQFWWKWSTRTLVAIRNGVSLNGKLSN
jgi:hypothetical protein